MSKVFADGTVAVEGFDLSVARGEFVSLLGPSGCGKSTVLRLIAGLLRPTRGTVRFAQPLAPGDIGFVFQEPTLMPWATVADNVALPLRLRGFDGRRAGAAVAEALALVGLSSFARAYPHQLSGGMKMRVSLARALVTRPTLLLMDEPFAALDEITRLRLDDELARLWQAHGWTVLFVTHSVFESVYLSTRIVVMAARPGRPVAEIAVDAPRPREEDFRDSPLYGALCREVSAALHRAMASRGAET
ncbi:MAG: ABC transporter ATP-binding protein [Geminicoccaceae bacterium]|nr:ABC transporter ATP-binding protein [Geminicoccaceae bacterium]